MTMRTPGFRPKAGRVVSRRNLVALAMAVVVLWYMWPVDDAHRICRLCPGACALSDKPYEMPTPLDLPPITLPDVPRISAEDMRNYPADDLSLYVDIPSLPFSRFDYTIESLHVYYISMERNEQRRKRLMFELDAIGILPENRHWIRGVERKNGGLGCALAHHAALQAIKDAGHQVAMVVEDDLIWHREDADLSKGPDTVFVRGMLQKLLRVDTWQMLMLSGYGETEPSPLRYMHYCTHILTTSSYIIRDTYLPVITDVVRRTILLPTNLEVTDKQQGLWRKYYNHIDQEFAQVLQTRDRLYWGMAYPPLGLQAPGYSELQGTRQDKIPSKRDWTPESGYNPALWGIPPPAPSPPNPFLDYS